VGISHPKYTPALRAFAKIFAVVVFLGFVSVPVGVLTGLVV
jgi:succinate dehydrogenase / fumarate reductase cytochrome b subunit